MGSLLIIGLQLREKNWTCNGFEICLFAICHSIIIPLMYCFNCRVLVTCIVVALNNPLKCRSLDFIISMLVLISLNLLTILLCITIARISSRGAILQPFSRRHISTLLHIRLPVYIIELLCTIYSTIIAFGMVFFYIIDL